MKSKFLTVAVLLAFAAMFNSCAMHIVKSETSIVNPIEEPLMADIDVMSEKVTGTFTEGNITELVTGLAGLSKKRVFNEERIKLNAVYNALDNGKKGDLLIAPQFEIVKDVIGNRTKSVTVTVVGYPAFYKNFRPVPKMSDVEIREVSSEKPFVVISKDNDGHAINYQVANPVYPLNMESIESIKVNPNAISTSDKTSGKGKNK